MAAKDKSSESLRILSDVQCLAPDLFAVDGLLRMFPGAVIPVRMTIIRLSNSNSDLVVYSPFPPHLVDLSTYGRVAAVVAPSCGHFLWARAFADAHPGSTLYASAGLAAKRPSEDWGTLIDENSSEEIVSNDVAVKYLHSSLLCEVVLCHKPSRTFICCDLAFNMPKSYTSPLVPWTTQLFLWFSDVQRPLCSSRLLKMLLKPSCPALLLDLDYVLKEWDWDRFVPGHGLVVESGAKEVFTSGMYQFVKENGTPSSGNNPGLCRYLIPAAAVAIIAYASKRYMGW